MYRVYDWIYSESGIGGGKRQTFQIDCSSDEGDNTSTKDQIKAGSIRKKAGNQKTENPCKKRSQKKAGTKEIVERKLKPVAIMFSEYYFYVTAFISDEEIKKDFEVLNDSFPTIYRIDRIRELKILDEKFFIPYRNRFEEGEFRKRIQFMYGGKLRNVKFKYTGDDIDAILDRLPTAQILEERKGYYIVKAEVFGKGIDMWLRSQGDKVEVMG